MLEKKRVTYDRYRNMVKLFVTIMGLWPSKNSTKLEHIIRFVHIISIFFLLFSFSYYCKGVSNISQFVGGLGLILAYLSHVIKSSCILIKFQEFCDLKNTIDKRFNQLLNDENLRKYLLEEVYDFYYLSMNDSLAATVLSICLLLSPIVMLLLQYLRHDSVIILPLVYQSSSYPWEVQVHSLVYWITYILQNIGALSGFVITVGVDSVYMLYILQMVGLLSVLAYQLKNLEHQKDYQVILHQCIDEYVTLTICRDKIQEIFGPIILWTILSNGFVMCSLIFQITHIKSMPLFQMITFAVYTYYKLSQTFMYVWTGTRLMTESEKCQEATVDMDWQNNSKLKSASLIMLPQRPLQLVACHFSIISVDLFVKVVNTAVSYFFLIATLEEK